MLQGAVSVTKRFDAAFGTHGRRDHRSPEARAGGLPAKAKTCRLDRGHFSFGVARGHRYRLLLDLTSSGHDWRCLRRLTPLEYSQAAISCLYRKSDSAIVGSAEHPWRAGLFLSTRPKRGAVSAHWTDWVD